MEPEVFLNLFIKEVDSNPTLNSYYKLGSNHKPHKFAFRYNYYLSRLQYIYNFILKQNNPDIYIWDCGCGYGTTALFLAMNGIKCYGSTLEFYFEHIEQRKLYWSTYGDTELFTYGYEDLFSFDKKKTFDIVLLQDTLHHIEPIDEAIPILKASLKENGVFLVTEENGANIIQTIKLFLQRGNKKIIPFYDPKLNKTILMGNENIRSLKQWTLIFEKHNLKIEHVGYIRYYLPFVYIFIDKSELLFKETIIERKSIFRKNKLYFGLSFLVSSVNLSMTKGTE